MIVVLWTDALIYLLVASITGFMFYARTREHLRAPWREVMRKPLAMSALMILTLYVCIGFLDSLHFKPELASSGNSQVQYAAAIDSVLDVVLQDLKQGDEKTYSAPFATHLYGKETIEDSSGGVSRRYLALKYAGTHLDNPQQRAADVTRRVVMSVLGGLVLWAVIVASIVAIVAWRTRDRVRMVLRGMWKGRRFLPWRAIFSTLALVTIAVAFMLNMAGSYHIFGTDKVGEDVLYQSIKSIRTGLVIGSLTTFIMLPLAVLFGTMAGYFKSWIDDAIQYVYTTLSSIPDILLIAAAVLMMQVYMETHPDMFGTGVERADFRLLFLCIILGVTGWTGLCRLLRAETLKLTNLEYVQAAEALGTGWFSILTRHIVPNVMHLILITVVLQFSGLVLAEAVLSYLNIGVDPTMYSWGNMINSSRLELAREPIVWWSFLAAFVFMFLLVLSANLFADSVRDAFDPRLRDSRG